MLFHVVCDIAVCECKRAAMFQRSKCRINGVIVSHERGCGGCWMVGKSQTIPMALVREGTIEGFVTILHTANHDLHWLAINNIYFDPPSNTVSWGLEEFGMCRWHVDENPLSKYEDSGSNWYLLDSNATVHFTVGKFRYGKWPFVSDEL